MAPNDQPSCTGIILARSDQALLRTRYPIKRFAGVTHQNLLCVQPQFRRDFVPHFLQFACEESCNSTMVTLDGGGLHGNISRGEDLRSRGQLHQNLRHLRQENEACTNSIGFSERKHHAHVRMQVRKARLGRLRRISTRGRQIVRCWVSRSLKTRGAIASVAGKAEFHRFIETGTDQGC